MLLNYQKLHGCHNEYIYLNFLDSPLPEPTDWAALSQKISGRNGSIGSDGLILLLPPDNPAKAEVKMRMFNVDGSEAEMCGNGVRCVAKLYFEMKSPDSKSPIRVETLAGIRECFVLEHNNPERFIIKVNMGRPSFLPANIPVDFDDVVVVNEEFDVDGKTFMMSCVSIGNPHCVIEVKDLDTFDVERYGRQIEKHSAFPKGINVEFIEMKDDLVFQRTWERGSGETKACGTGACAVGVTMVFRNRIDSPVDIRLRGGDLRVEWDGLREVWLTGEAVSMSSGQIEI
ncbi:MAG: diaminopimelate epimerase [Deltaproteobacteria bacterium CG11_big_fil_rev_8_21_14_0_20_45_16]|nr:MAG: diaminopimelate epimerase [Deltaproteobacteria bacterium CG11_big_fil_rev_8_21_14_0_20_45_16]